jgi:hypothetical protein
MVDCLRALGCQIAEHSISSPQSAAISRPGTAISGSHGTIQPTFTGSRSQTVTASTSTIKKTPARRPPANKKTTQVPTLPALPPITQVGQLPGAQFQSRSLSAVPLFADQAGIEGVERSTYFQNNSSHITRHATVADYPLSQTIPQPVCRHESTLCPTAPAITTRLGCINTDIPMHDQGNAAFVEQFHQNRGPLPPQRVLPFARPSSVPPPTHSATANRSAIESSLFAPKQANETLDLVNQPDMTTNSQLTDALAPTPLSEQSNPLGASEAQSDVRPSVSTMREATHSTRALANYSSLSEEDRWAIVEDGIIACLKDDNFVQFCEDLSNMWSRIGLDMKIDGHFNP